MVEVAIVSMNVALHGMPRHAERTPEGWAILRSYRESDPDYVPEAEAVEAVADALAAETLAAAQQAI